MNVSIKLEDIFGEDILSDSMQSDEETSDKTGFLLKENQHPSMKAKFCLRT